MRFVPYDQAAGQPNIIVDGAATHGTVLTLSHWPKSGTPPGLKADTSAEIVFKYLDDPSSRVAAEVASNNHFDEDGLVGIFSIVNPAAARDQRALLVDVARAGDFGVYDTREAARIAMTLGVYADADQSPLDQRVFELSYAEQAAALYQELLHELPKLLADVSPYRDLWEDEDALLTDSEHLLDRGIVTIEEEADLELAVVRIPEERAECHQYALHTRTPCSRLLIVHGRRVELRYRYESWVQFASRRVAPRVDLAPLAEELNQQERSGGRWLFDGVDAITPRLWLEHAPETSWPAAAILDRTRHHLRTGRPAWNPYN